MKPTLTLRAPTLKPAAMPTPKPFAARLSAATRPAMVLVAPGRYAPANPAEPPDYTICTWSRLGDGTYAPQPDQTRMLRLTGALTRRLGFSRPDTILRLGRAGFVEVVKVAPQAYMINLDSWWNHVRRCAEDPEFWDSAERLAEYRKSL